MSRALFVDQGEAQVIAKCQSENVGISTIEALPAGGVRLVCNSSEGAGTMMRAFKAHLIKGEVVRARHRPAKPLW